MKSVEEVRKGIDSLTDIYNDKLKKYNAVAVYYATTTVTYTGKVPKTIIGRMYSKDNSNIGSFKMHYEIDNDLSIKDMFLAMIYEGGEFTLNKANANQTNVDKVIRSFKSAADEMNKKLTIETLKDSWSS